MLLYHVSLDINPETSKLFIPRVPDSIGSFENATIPRICLADSVEHCIEAILPKGIQLFKGDLIQIYKANFDEADTNLLTPARVREYVADALFTHEHWYLSSISMPGSIFKIAKIATEICLNLSAISFDAYLYFADQVLGNIMPVDEIYLHYCPASVIELDNYIDKELHAKVGSTISEEQYYQYRDNLWDTLAEIKQTQGRKITQLSLKALTDTYKTSVFS